MTCQHCQTWILDDDHRCRRCGRRVKNAPGRISPDTYPIAATATAPVYEREDQALARAGTTNDSAPIGPPNAQQSLFSAPSSDRRVIPFGSLTTPGERESIRLRAAELPRPAPVKTAKVEVRRARSRPTRGADQPRLDFQGQEEVLARPQSNIICDAPVAPLGLRMKAAVVDTGMMAMPCAFVLALFLFGGGQFSFDKQVLPFFALALTTIPLSYKLLWTFAARDTPGIRWAGLRLVDFDGNPPSQSRRYQRLFGSMLSLLAGGIGLIWSFVDEDSLTWHDHISATFPTVAFEN